jgi:hypothetical protein
MSKELVRYQGKVVGYIEDRYFFTQRDEKTIFRKFNSVNISLEVVKAARMLGAIDFVFVVTRKGQTRKIVISYMDLMKCRLYDNNGDTQFVVYLKKYEPKTYPNIKPIDFYIKSDNKAVEVA